MEREDAGVARFRSWLGKADVVPRNVQEATARIAQKAEWVTMFSKEGGYCLKLLTEINVVAANPTEAKEW